MHPLLSLLVSLAAILLVAWLVWPDTGLYARWRRAGRLSNRVLAEDALKHLFSSEMENLPVTLPSVAGAISVSQNAAAEIVGNLESRGYLSVQEGQLRLTSTGREYALRIIRAHRIWERYLSERTGHDETIWHDLAERYEHQLSPAEVDTLATRLGNPSHDPHGDPIPTATGEYRPITGIPLTDLSADQTAKILHLEDEPAVIYSQLVAEDLHAGMVLRVLEVTEEKIRFWANGDEHILAPLLANNITVMPIEQQIEALEATIPLTELEIGRSGKVVAISPAIRGIQRRRLMDLGLLPGTEITAEIRSPSGDPTGYLLRGSLIALREEQARQIRITTNGNSP